MQDLRKLIQTYPVIDNHAHNLFTKQHASISSAYPFELLTSEAQGEALTKDSTSSIAHMRAVKELSELLKCDATLVAVKAARDKEMKDDYVGYTKRCLEGTHVILMDDGIQHPEGVALPVAEHVNFVPSVYRIVRIEQVAEEVLKATLESSETSRASVEVQCEVFTQEFEKAIKAIWKNTEVHGFKSVVCYRSGLDIATNYKRTDIYDRNEWGDFMCAAKRERQYKIKCKVVNDYLVTTVCKILSNWADKYPYREPPFQFHTGLGDTDINLLRSNPAHMQPLIVAFPKVKFVLLHSSYPYTREAGYLASHYSNVWLDIGEVFPILSRDGEESVLRQALELVPATKILWSTDGRFYPETYWLANKHFREALEKILVKYVNTGDMNARQAIDVAVNIMFWNSNNLYGLGESHKFPQLLQACGRNIEASSSSAISQVQKPTSSTSLQTSEPQNDTSHPGKDRYISVVDAFLKQHPSIKYIWIQFLDYTGTMRQRMVPVAQYRRIIEDGCFPGVPSALLGLLQQDIIVPGMSATGQFLLVPDNSTLALNYAIDSPSATVQTWWTKDVPNADPAGEPLEGCPRWALKELVDLLADWGIHIRMGFEIEVVFMRPVLNAQKNDFVGFEPLHYVHSWSNMTYQQLDILPMIEEIAETLKEAGIPLQLFHAESAAGQWEFPLPADSPLKAVDTLYRARDIIRNVARKHGLKATLYPRPFKNQCGTASHAHFSINGPSDIVEKYEDSFLAGILAHLPSILAFTLPIEESYARMMAGIWAGGEYIAWGTQNREAPIRKCGEGHWELKTVDGIGNMYLSMTALLAAGRYGVKYKLRLTHKDLSGCASSLSEEERENLGITKKMPNTLEKSLAALEGNGYFNDILPGLVKNYIAVKRGELHVLRGLGDMERRTWLMSRY